VTSTSNIPPANAPQDAILARVARWSDEDGVGLLSAVDEQLGAIWAHYSAIDVDGYRSLVPGETVYCKVEAPAGGQDGYTYRATWIKRVADEGRPPRRPPFSNY
jgi:CspA family cold shock protein